MPQPLPAPPPIDGLATTPSLRTLGAGAQQAAAGNDDRLRSSNGALGLGFDPNTVALWHMDDSGATAADATGNWPLTAYGGPPASVKGQVNLARQTSDTTCLISGTITQAVMDMLNTGAWTFGGWFCPTSTVASLYISRFFQVNGLNLGIHAYEVPTAAILFDVVNMRPYLEAFTTTGTATDHPIGAVNCFPLNTRTHLLVTRSAAGSQGGNATWTFYVNGVQVGTYTGPTPSQASSGTFTMGVGGYKDVNGTYPGFKGSVDDVFLYSGALTAAQALAVYNAAVAPSMLSLTALGSSPNTAGASVYGPLLTLQPADATHPGLLSAGTQSIGGAKRFTQVQVADTGARVAPLFVGGHVAVGDDAPAALDPNNYWSIWLKHGVCIRSDDNASFQHIALASNIYRISPGSGWGLIDNTLPGWTQVLGAGSSVDYWSITRTPAGGNPNSPSTLMEMFASGRLRIGGGADDGVHQLQVVGSASASNLSGTNTGDVTLGTASGLSLSGQVLSLALATNSTPGALSAADKTTLGNQSGTNTGDLTLAAVGSSPSANGASLSGQVLTLQPADATHPGLLTAAGFTTLSNQSGTNSGDVTIGTANGLSLSGQALSLAVATDSVPGAMSAADHASLSALIASGGASGVTTLAAVGSSPNANAGSISSTTLTLEPADGTNPGVLTAGTQTIGGDKTFSGAISASNLSGTNAGDLTLAAVGASPSANGASLSGQVLTLQPADGTHPGLLTSGTQTIGGAKTFSSTISASNLSGTNTGDVTLGAVGSTANANGASLSGQVLTLQPASSTFPGLMSASDKNNLDSLVAAGGGAITLAAVGSSPNANGATSSGMTLTLQPASASFPGLLTAAGFTTLSNQSGTNSGDVSLAAVGSSPSSSGASLSGQTLTLQPADGTRPGVLTAGAQTIGGAKTFSAAISASNLSGTNTGDITLASVGSSPNGNGASLSGQALTLQPADGSNPGLLTASTQTIGGAKTFSVGFTVTSGNATLTNGNLVLSTNGNSINNYNGTQSIRFVNGQVYLKADNSDASTNNWHVFDTSVALTQPWQALINIGQNGNLKGWFDKDAYYSLATIHPVGVNNPSNAQTTYGKQTGLLELLTTADVSFNAVGLPTPLMAGTVTAAPAQDSARNMLGFATDGTNGGVAGLGGPYTATRADYRTRFSCLFRTDSAVTSTRIYIGLTDADLSGVTTLAGMNSNRAIVLRYDTTIGDTNWMLVTSDGTTASASSVGLAPAGNKTYAVTIGHFTSGKCICSIQDVSGSGGNVTKTTNLPTGATNLGIQASITALTAAARNLYIARISLEQN
jgi:hypothetical protein